MRRLIERTVRSGWTRYWFWRGSRPAEVPSSESHDDGKWAALGGQHLDLPSTSTAISELVVPDRCRRSSSGEEVLLRPQMDAAGRLDLGETGAGPSDGVVRAGTPRAPVPGATGRVTATSTARVAEDRRACLRGVLRARRAAARCSSSRRAPGVPSGRHPAAGGAGRGRRRPPRKRLSSQHRPGPGRGEAIARLQAAQPPSSSRAWRRPRSASLRRTCAWLQRLQGEATGRRVAARRAGGSSARPWSLRLAGRRGELGRRGRGGAGAPVDRRRRLGEPAAAGDGSGFGRLVEPRLDQCQEAPPRCRGRGAGSPRRSAHRRARPPGRPRQQPGSMARSPQFRPRRNVEPGPRPTERRLSRHLVESDCRGRAEPAQTGAAAQAALPRRAARGSGLTGAQQIPLGHGRAPRTDRRQVRRAHRLVGRPHVVQRPWGGAGNRVSRRRLGSRRTGLTASSGAPPPLAARAL